MAQLADRGRTTPSWICHQSVQAQASGASVWLGETGQHSASGESTWKEESRLVFSAVDDSVQSGSAGQVDSGNVGAGGRVSGRAWKRRPIENLRLENSCLVSK